MLRRYLLAVLFHVFLLFSTAAFAQGGKVTVDGKVYTVHQVLTGETFYSISLTYNVHVDTLRGVNRLLDANAAIRPGDMLIIPLYAVRGAASTPSVVPVVAKPATPPATPPVATTPSVTNGSYLRHTVATGETLYSVARLYPHTTVAEIKELNQLQIESLSIGQVLLIPAIKGTPGVRPTTPPSTQPVDTHAIYKPSGAILTSDSNVTAAPNRADSSAASAASFDLNMLQDLERKYTAVLSAGTEQTVTGTATWITDPSHENQYRFYAMHKTAPIGSILKVKNLMNDRVVYAKVIGKLPNTQANAKIIVKLSGASARYLNVLDDKFMIELSTATKTPVVTGEQ